jgi:hypothetical protein
MGVQLQGLDLEIFLRNDKQRHDVSDPINFVQVWAGLVMEGCDRWKQ